MASKRDIPKTIGLRASSNRTVRLGLIAVGLGTGPALDASARVSGKLHTADGETVKQVYRVEDTGEIVERADLVTMYEHDGALVTLREDEKPYLEGSDTIDLIANLAADEVPSEWITGTNLAWPRDTANDQGYMRRPCQTLAVAASSPRRKEQSDGEDDADREAPAPRLDAAGRRAGKSQLVRQPGERIRGSLL